MSTRELIALGTSSQTPTSERSHNAYLLRWDGNGFLLDPGEGVQRQLTLAGVSACSIYSICISHFHGDHCLGLPGILQRLSLDRCDHPIHVYYPESGQIYFERLCGAAVYQSQIEVVGHPIGENSDAPMELSRTDKLVLKAQSLEHSIPTLGYRLEEPAGLRFLPEKLDRAGIQGPMIGELQRKGSISVGSRIVRVEDVTTYRPGNVFAFVMDTRPCSMLSLWLKMLTFSLWKQPTPPSIGIWPASISTRRPRMPQGPLWKPERTAWRSLIFHNAIRMPRSTCWMQRKSLPM